MNSCGFEQYLAKKNRALLEIRAYNNSSVVIIKLLQKSFNLIQEIKDSEVMLLKLGLLMLPVAQWVWVMEEMKEIDFKRTQHVSSCLRIVHFFICPCGFLWVLTLSPAGGGLDSCMFVSDSNDCHAQKTQCHINLTADTQHSNTDWSQWMCKGKKHKNIPSFCAAVTGNINLFV